jgi:hypothetical protein
MNEIPTKKSYSHILNWKAIVMSNYAMNGIKKSTNNDSYAFLSYIHNLGL